MRNSTTGMLINLVYSVVWIITVVSAPFQWLGNRRRVRNLPPDPSPISRPDRPLRSEAHMSMKRAVGYCEDEGCDDYAKGVFLLNHGDTFYCPRCREQGYLQPERGFYTGETGIFKEVRVEYNFGSIDKVFQEVAVVRDESLWGVHSVYTLQSPLIKTEMRALKVAECMLASLNRSTSLIAQGEIPRTTEILLSFDDSPEEFSRRLKVVAEGWSNSALTRHVAREDLSASSHPI